MPSMPKLDLKQSGEAVLCYDRAKQKDERKDLDLRKRVNSFCELDLDVAWRP